ncbi:MAG: PTS sugar transporter subunit IIB [Erysipelotrichia bacterium]|jgi:PTS system mannose-specific IIB component|nr:PTS sugar transporter subunit IIB [Erysipelotrichia bacterium]
MIVQIRIDDRLIHGQVAMVWSKELNTPRIIVANNEAAVNDTVKMTLKMATPTGIKTIVKDLEGAARLINDPQTKDMRIFGLTKNVRDALYLVKTCGDNIWEVNLANTGQFTGENVPKTRLPGNRVSLTEPEIEAARELIGILGDKFFSLLIPSSKKETVSDLLKAVGKLE